MSFPGQELQIVAGAASGLKLRLNATNEVTLQKFQAVVTLLTLVLAINNNGHASLPRPLSKRNITNTDGVGPLDILDVEEPKNRTVPAVLSALAAVLVRNNEIIAVAGGKSTKAYSLLAIGDNESGDNESGDNESDSQPLTFTAIANPDHRCVHHSCEVSKEVYAVITDSGESHWNKLDPDSWIYTVQISKEDTLANHFDTVMDFMREYRRATGSARQLLFHRFSQYIISRSHHKMYRRITHWVSLGFLSNLCNKNLTENTLQGWVSQWCPHESESISANNRLKEVLEGLDKNKLLGTLMKTYHSVAQENPANENPAPFATLREVLANNAVMQKYNTSTCFQFHQLLVSALLAYRNTLHRLKTEKDSQSQITHFKELYLFSLLLWRIAYTKSFSQHLIVLRSSNVLAIPAHDLKKFYLLSLPPLPGTKLTDKTTVDDPESSEDFDFQEVVDHRHVGILPIVTKTKKWLRINVSHWVAINILSSLGRAQTYSSLEATLFSLRLPPLPPSELKTTIQDIGFEPDVSSLREILSLPNSPIQEVEALSDVEVVLEVISQNAKLLAPEDKNENSIFTKCFGSPKKMPSSGTVHCEVALVSLVKYLRNFTDSTENSEVGKILPALEKTSLQWVGVSKLCCPVCWDVLNLIRLGRGDLTSSTDLGPDSEKLEVRGHHTTLYPVRLPPWLPNSVLNAMLLLYSNRLKVELQKLISKGIYNPKDRKGHSRVPSLASDVISDDSGSESGDDRDSFSTPWIFAE